MNKEYLTPKDVSSILRIGMTKTYELVNRADFPKIRIGRNIVVPQKQFEEYMTKCIGGKL